MSGQSSDKPVRQFTGWHMLALVGGFFGIVISVNVTMAVLASGTWTGLVVKNSYVASQEYNTVLRDARAQAALGWTSKLSYEDGRLRFLLLTQDGTALAGAGVDARLSRPVGTNQDDAVDFSESAPGKYERPIKLGAGVWNVEVVAKLRAGTAYRQIFRLHVPKER